jgi:hypothetical protein
MPDSLSLGFSYALYFEFGLIVQHVAICLTQQLTKGFPFMSRHYSRLTDLQIPHQDCPYDALVPSKFEECLQMMQQDISGLYWSRFYEDAHAVLLLVSLQDFYLGTTVILVGKVTQMHEQPHPQ